MPDLQTIISEYFLTPLEDVFHISVKEHQKFATDETQIVIGAIVGKATNSVVVAYAGQLFIVPDFAVTDVEIDESIKVEGYTDQIGAKLSVVKSAPILRVSACVARDLSCSPQPTVVAQPSEAARYAVLAQQVEERDDVRNDKLMKTGVPVPKKNATDGDGSITAEVKKAKKTIPYNKTTAFDSKEESSYNTAKDTTSNGTVSTDFEVDTSSDIATENQSDLEYVEQPSINTVTSYDTKQWTMVNTSVETKSVKLGIPEKSTDYPLDPKNESYSDTTADMQHIDG